MSAHNDYLCSAKSKKRFISGITYKGSKTMIILNYVVISLAAKAMSLMKK